MIKYWDGVAVSRGSRIEPYQAAVDGLWCGAIEGKDAPERLAACLRPPLHLGPRYKDPEVGSVPITDFFSDSFVSWFRRMSSLVMVFFVFRSTISLASARGPFPASQRTLPAREVILPTDAEAFPYFLSCWVWLVGLNAWRPPTLADITACDIIMAAIFSQENC